MILVMAVLVVKKEEEIPDAETDDMQMVQEVDAVMVYLR